jgi:hypothetical protein
MGFMTCGTVRNLAMHLVAEGAGLFCMSALVIGKILPRALMAGQTGLFYITGKAQGQGFMRVRVAGQAVFQFKMRPAFMTIRALGNDILSPGRVRLVAIKTRNSGLMLAPVPGYCCRLIFMALDAIRYFESYPCRFCLMGKYSQHERCKDNRA